MMPMGGRPSRPRGSVWQLRVKVKPLQRLIALFPFPANT